MAKTVSVQLDDDAHRALHLLQSTGLSEAEAIRSSLLAAADRLRRGRQLAAEVAALEADDEDRTEMLAVASLTESMRSAAMDDTDDLLSDPAAVAQINESRAALSTGDVMTADQLRAKYLS